jgi:hypothetical protein
MAKDIEIYLYTDDAAVTHPIRISTAAATAQTSVATQGTATSKISARVGGSRRQRGLLARGVRLTRKVGTAPNQGTRSTFLPILKKADWDALTEGSSVTVDSVAYTVSSQVSERAK